MGDAMHREEGPVTGSLNRGSFCTHFRIEKSGIALNLQMLVL